MRYAYALVLLTAAHVQAQSEAALKSYFASKRAVLKLDMPASKEGIEIYPQARSTMNLKHYQSRLAQFGPSLQKGDSFTFTAVRVNAKSIELDLQGGDFGILSDERPSPFAASFPKEPPASRHVLGRGRFTISIKGVIPEPLELRTILSEFVDFGEGSSGPRSQIQAAASSVASKLKKGMTESEVLRLLGAPRQSREHQEGEFIVVTNTFFSGDQSIEVDFVKNSVVNFRIHPR